MEKDNIGNMLIINNRKKLPSVKIVFLLLEALKERLGEHLLRVV